MKNLKIMLVAVTLFTITQASDYADLESPEKISKQERAVWINNFFNPVSDYVQEGYKAFQDSYTQGVERQDSSESQGLSPQEAAILATDIMNKSTEVATTVVKTATTAVVKAIEQSREKVTAVVKNSSQAIINSQTEDQKTTDLTSTKEIAKNYVSIDGSRIKFCGAPIFDMTTDEAKIAMANKEMLLTERLMIEGNLTLSSDAKNEAKLAWYNQQHRAYINRMQILSGSALFVGSIVAYALYTYLQQPAQDTKAKEKN